MGRVSLHLVGIVRCAVLLGVGAVLVIGLVRPAPQLSPLPGGGDLDLFSAIVSELQQGTPYYEAFGTELRARGYPTASLANWRTPLHLPAVALSVNGARWLLNGAALGLLLAGASAAIGRGPAAVAFATFCLMGAVLPVWLGSTAAVMFGEVWCGMFIGLSVAAYLRRQWVLGALAGVAAVFLRELAVPYTVVCGLLAIRAQRRNEGLVWFLGGAAYLVYYGVHAWCAYAAMGPEAQAHEHSWVRWQGLPFVYATAQWYGWAAVAPQVVAPFVVAGGIAAAAAPSMALQLRLAIITYMAFFSVIGQEFNSYWGLVTTPLWAFGLSYTREGLRWLVGQERSADFVSEAGRR